MRTTIIARAVIPLLLLFGAAAAMAAPIRLSFRAATVTAGTTFDVPIYIDSTLTGLGVSSYEIVFNYSSPAVEFTGVVSVTGTLSESWGLPTINATVPGQIRIAGAGVSALAGTGPLVTLRFSSPPRTSIQYPSFHHHNHGVAACDSIAEHGSCRAWRAGSVQRIWRSSAVFMVGHEFRGRKHLRDGRSDRRSGWPDSSGGC
jgi:hypothetical protein